MSQQTTLGGSTVGNTGENRFKRRSDWETALDHAHINHESQPWEIFNNGRFQAEPERAFELLTSWTTHFLSVTDHAHEWGNLDLGDKAPDGKG